MAQPTYYTCKGKGGKYVVVSYATGAGTSKGTKVMVYRDTESRQLFFRTPEDFRNRMEVIPPTCCVCGTTENLYDDGRYGWRCRGADCIPF